jgi:hypothetical protein
LKTLVLITLLALSAPFAHADIATFSGQSGSLKASAKFDFSGNDLIITLTNTATVAPDASNQTLTGVFFNLTGQPALTKVSATIAPGSSIVQTNQCDVNCVGSTDVGGEFGYATGVGPSFYGISSSGYIGGAGTLFGGLDFDAPDSPNGINFGIVHDGFVDGSGNGGMDNDPLIDNSVVFTFSGVAGLTAAAVSQVVFTYGTSLTEPSFPGTRNPPQSQVPEPSSILLLGTMVAATCHVMYKRRIA